MNSRRGRRGERGAAFLLVFFTMALISLLGVALLTVGTSELRGAQFRKQHAQAFNAAEGGLDHACALLAASPGWRAGLDEALGAGRYEVSLEDEGDGVVLVTSVGQWGPRVETVQARVRVEPPAAFGYALFSDGGLELKKDATISGDVHLNGDLTGDGDVAIDGELMLTGGDFFEGELTVTGDIGEGAPPIESPVPDLAWYQANCTQHLYGNQQFSGGTYSDDIILVEGTQCLVSGTYSGHVTFVATGKIHVSQDLVTEGPDSRVDLVGLGGVDIDGAKVVQALVWSPALVEVMGGKVDITGALVGSPVDITCQLSLEWDSRFYEEPPPGAPGGELEVLEWSGHPGD